MTLTSIAKRTTMVSVAAVLVLGSMWTTTPKVTAAEGVDPCGRALQATAARDAGGRTLCTHGTDNLPRSSGPTALPPAAPPPCFESPDTYRIQVLYGVPADRQSKYDERLPVIRAGVALADSMFEQSAGVGQHLKWLCEGGQVSVTQVPLVAVGSDGVYTFNDVLSSLTKGGKSQSVSRYDRSDRIYVVFLEGTKTEYYNGGGGHGTMDRDSSDSPSNANNFGPAYATVNGYDVDYHMLTVLPHEIGHTLGAVQLDAPHSSGKAHCYDEFDLMCYDDGGSYFQNGGQLQNRCIGSGYPNPSSLNDYRWECGTNDDPLYQNGDDYYSVAPPPGSYIDTHWNVACSRWVYKAIAC